MDWTCTYGFSSLRQLFVSGSTFHKLVLVIRNAGRMLNSTGRVHRQLKGVNDGRD